MTARAKSTVRVLIADDHTVVLEGLAAIIRRQADMAVVAKAANGREAVALWRQHHPDVALIDLRMPELDGIGVIREIVANDAAARVIVLTTYDTDEDIYQAIQAGARGYLLKDQRRDELLECIRRVHAGETWIPAELAGKLAKRVRDKAPTKRELAVLALLARGKSNKEISATFGISQATVKSHLKHLFSKLHAENRTEAVTEAIRRGILR